MPLHSTAARAAPKVTAQPRPHLVDPLLGQRAAAASQAEGPSFAGVLNAESLLGAGEQLVRAASQATACRVLAAVYEPGGKRFRLIGDSRGLEKPRRLTAGDPIEQTLTESRLLASTTEGVCHEPTSAIQTPIREELARRNGARRVGVFLLASRSGRLQAALLFLHEGDAAQGAGEGLFDAPPSALATCLGLRRDAEASWWDRLRSDATRVLRTKRTKLIGAAVAGAALLLAVPAPYRVGAECRCEPTSRRLVTAPFDAQLEACLVKPGDRVTAGQLLAVFEGKGIASEIDSLSAEREQAEQRYNAAVAGGDSTGAAESLLEIERLDSKIEMLRQQLSRLELHSAIDGVVVSGDLEESLGATLATGQRLLEIAPLDRMTAEVAIDEADIGLVSVGDRVSLGFDARPGVSFTGRVERVFPRAEIVNGENVYVAEARVEGEPGVLSPGMTGRAKIETGWRPLAWTVVRTPYQALRRFWGWY